MTNNRRLSRSKSADGWFEDYDNDEESFQIDEYDLTSTPNDFNVSTIYNFIESRAISIPGFQRNYVWDIGRASKLIESLILGLPVPQVFLYEESRNKFLVIDGQQRLMSIYYFVKQRFPRKEKRGEIRRAFEENGHIPDSILYDDNYFSNFNLILSEIGKNKPNKFSGINYSTLSDYKFQFDLRPIRNVIVKQNLPRNDDSSIYEIFNRLNSGGVNLGPQEIRSSLYNSDFYDTLYKINTSQQWRNLLQLPDSDLHMKDIEILLRGFAMLIEGNNYAPPLVKFLNNFSRQSKVNRPEQNTYLESLFFSFLKSCQDLPSDAFLNKQSKRLNIALYEAVFVAICEEPFSSRSLVNKRIDLNQIQQLENDTEFIEASQTGTAKTVNVSVRLNRARSILS